jgi:hypothetical protein
LTENVLLLTATGQNEKPGRLLDVVTAVASVKFCALVPAGLVAISGTVVAGARLIRHRRGPSRPGAHRSLSRG